MHTFPVTVWSLLFLFYLGGAASIATQAIPSWGDPPSKTRVTDLPPALQILLALIVIFAWPAVAVVLMVKWGKKP